MKIRDFQEDQLELVKTLLQEKIKGLQVWQKTFNMNTPNDTIRYAEVELKKASILLKHIEKGSELSRILEDMYTCVELQGEAYAITHLEEFAGEVKPTYCTFSHKAKIALVGAQSSGKTTALHYVFTQLKLEGYSNVAIMDEPAQDCPYPINKDADFKTQMWILLSTILQEQKLCAKWDVVITDRSVIDGLMYFRYIIDHCNPADRERLVAEYTTLKTIADAWIERAPYTMIYFLEPLPIYGDADRPNDAVFQKEVFQIFETYFWGRRCITIRETDKSKRSEGILRSIKQVVEGEIA